MYNEYSKSVGSRITNQMLPRVEDKFTFLYLEYTRIIQDEYSIAAYKDNQKYIIPLAMINALILGPGTSISHAAVKNVVDCGCTLIWSGQDLNYIYATGMGCGEYSKNLILQAKCYSDNVKHMHVIRRMYQIRYPDVNLAKFSISQMRGMEGKRVKAIYDKLAEKYQVQWDGRAYDTENFDRQNSINKMITAGNQLLYAICQAAIISFGMSPGLGFIHNGHTRSFVFDMADLYKEDMVLPAAFQVTAEFGSNTEELRKACRRQFTEKKLMKRIAKDLSGLFEFPDMTTKLPSDVGLWNFSDVVASGKNYGVDGLF